MSGTIAVCVTGRVVEDAEKAPMGDDAIKFRIAVNKRVKSKEGVWEDKAVFVRCISWRGAAHTKVASKGNLVTVHGDIGWDSAGEGKNFYAPEVKVWEVDLHVTGAGGAAGRGAKAAAAKSDEDLPF